MPQSASGNQLFAQTSFENSNVLQIDLRQDVDICIAGYLGLLQNEVLSTWICR